LRFKQDTIVFGTVQEDEKIGAEFIFENIGKDPLEIEIVSACECIYMDWTEGPIPAKALGRINLIFNTAGHSGNQSKTIDVIFKNTDTNDYPLVKQVQLLVQVLPKRE
jgi:hypothetical protein